MAIDSAFAENANITIKPNPLHWCIVKIPIANLARQKSGKLENRFNKDDVQKELDFQREVTEKFGPNVAEAGSFAC